LLYYLSFLLAHFAELFLTVGCQRQGIGTGANIQISLSVGTDKCKQLPYLDIVRAGLLTHPASHAGKPDVVHPAQVKQHLVARHLKHPAAFGPLLVAWSLELEGGGFEEALVAAAYRIHSMAVVAVHTACEELNKILNTCDFFLNFRQMFLGT
jgi:hypothetical protein